jgi:hypothetical protein
MRIARAKHVTMTIIGEMRMIVTKRVPMSIAREMRFPGKQFSPLSRYRERGAGGVRAAADARRCPSPHHPRLAVHAR